jgi:hypothetical protein
MSETLNKAIAFLDAAIAELDKQTRPAPDHSVIEQRRERPYPRSGDRELRQLDLCHARTRDARHRASSRHDRGSVGASRRRSIIEQASADTVITFGPNGMTGHPDHVAVSRWTTAAVSGLPGRPRLLYATKTAAWADNYAPLHARLPLFGPDGPPRSAARDVAIALELAPPLLNRKLAARPCHTDGALDRSHG